jgi:hypothetical protein
VSSDRLQLDHGLRTRAVAPHSVSVAHKAALPSTARDPVCGYAVKLALWEALQKGEDSGARDRLVAVKVVWRAVHHEHLQWYSSHAHPSKARRAVAMWEAKSPRLRAVHAESRSLLGHPEWLAGSACVGGINPAQLTAVRNHANPDGQ